MSGQVTIVVVPRERFSFTRPSLESLYQWTDGAVELIYVDGGSPSPFKDYLEQESGRRGFRLIRTDHFLSPNRARNLALGYVKTRYVVFVDNDILFFPGWLEALRRCAEETGAWIVAPVCCVGEGEENIVHIAGGEARIEERDGGRFLHEHHRFAGARLSDIRYELRREPCELAEFHCMLVRADVFGRVGLLDEELLSSPEHIDLCLQVRGAGGTVFFEPSSVVSYVPPLRFSKADLRYFLLRWSEVWNRASLIRFRLKWNLCEDDPFLRAHDDWLRRHRQMFLTPSRDFLRPLLGRKPSRWLLRRVLLPLEIGLNRRLYRDETLGAGNPPISSRSLPI